MSSILKGSPKQLLFSNQSTPVRKETKVYKPVLRSPMKPAPAQRPTARVTIPEEVMFVAKTVYATMLKKILNISLYNDCCVQICEFSSHHECTIPANMVFFNPIALRMAKTP